MSDGNEFAGPEALLGRLETNPRECVFLVGSPVVARESRGGPGVPQVPEIVDMLLDALRSTAAPIGEVEALLGSNPAHAYQRAFGLCYSHLGPDVANAIIRGAVLQARIPGADPPSILDAASKPVHHTTACEQLQANDHGWFLRDSVRALGRLLVGDANHYGRTLLTTNFDPLIEAAITRQGGAYHSSVLHSDGSLSLSRGSGCHIVHLHGYWFGSDTLHLPHQLTQNRPQLKNSLKRILADKTLVVVAYGGWEDIIAHTLAEIASDPEANPDIIWTFFESDPDKIRKSYDDLFSRLAPAIARSRVAFYSGIDAHQLFPALARSRDLKPSIGHVVPLPSNEVLANFLGSCWGMEGSVPFFGQLFGTRTAARNAFDLYLQWTYGSLKADRTKIALSIIGEDLERYTFLLYPGERDVRQLWKNLLSEHLQGEADPTVHLLVPWFASFGDYWGKPQMKIVLQKISDGSPVLLQSFHVRGDKVEPARKHPITLTGVRFYSRAELADTQLEHDVHWAAPWTGISADSRRKHEPLVQKIEAQARQLGERKSRLGKKRVGREFKTPKR